MAIPGEKYLNLRQISNFCQGLPAWLPKFSNYSYMPLPHSFCFKSAGDMPLFCSEDLNFGAFSKYFHWVVIPNYRTAMCELLTESPNAIN
jgi:hypothetical protein